MRRSPRSLSLRTSSTPTSRLSRWVEKSRQLRKEDGAVSPVIGVILMVAITVTLAAVVFVLVRSFSDDGKDPAPAMAFEDDEVDDELSVIAGPPVSDNRDWSQLAVTGCTAPTGSVDAGDMLTACSGDVTIVDRETNTILYQGNFS